MHAHPRDLEDDDIAGLPHDGTAQSMRRIERSADRVARLEALREGFQATMIRRESRRAAAEISAHDSQVAAKVTSDAREDEDFDAWIHAEADAMLQSGWSCEQLAEFGFSPEIIRAAQRRHAGG
ncbi:hypothetical protein [Longimicrobium terrae]|uniref:Uncharacterized protein n=1 Tax=Longimicrobium terrae TaxID=1639882 RepID=A0A841H786_9BACT|nr:hypothetical protein [Longimicrobium terrae]MBB4637884.1 hypothetical protein [Longimicrobium terrae]MBB6074021.1 hypothetical protein [Longimicrobium terrae]NNC31182.1 hypothetical protein [Longimicrobium terrae]